MYIALLVALAFAVAGAFTFNMLVKPYAVYADGTKVEDPCIVSADGKELFKSFDPKPIYNEHLKPSYSAYLQAKEVSVKAYDDFKPIQNNMDFPELHYSQDEIPHMWKIYNEKKEYSDKCSNRTKELFEVYDRERRRTAGLFNFKMSAFIMLVYSLDEMGKALLADLNDIAGRGDNV